MKTFYVFLKLPRRSLMFRRLTFLLSATIIFINLSLRAEGSIYGPPVRTSTNQFSFSSGNYLYQSSTNLQHWTTTSDTNSSTFMFGLVGKNTITLNGDAVIVDSFNSAGSSYSPVETNTLSGTTLNNPYRSSDGQVHISLNGLTNFYYILETSSDLTNWFPVQTNSTLKDTGIATFQLSSNNAQTFFRAKGLGKRYYPLFEGALAVKEYIDLNGNNLHSDSYDSTNPNYSSYATNAYFGTNLVYDVRKRLDHGDIVATMGITNPASLGNVFIWGKLHTGPGSSSTTANIGPQGKVGDATFQASSSTGFQTGAWLYGMNVAMPAVNPPAAGGLTPGPGTYNSVLYTCLLSGNDQKYVIQSGTLGGKVCVSGSNVVLWAKGGLNFGSGGNDSGIYIAPGASVVIYVGNPSSTNVVTADLTGYGGINANGHAKNCQIYGLSNCTTIKMSGNAAFVGTIYAPNALLSGSGGGGYSLDSMGAIVVKRMVLNGHWHFHYDESLNLNGPNYSDPNVLGSP